MNRQDLLYVIELFFIENFPAVDVASSLTGMFGPSLRVTCPYFAGTITLQKHDTGYALVMDTFGYKHAFKTVEEFHTFVQKAYSPVLHAVNTLCEKTGGNQVGNAFVKPTADGNVAYVTEVSGGFIINVKDVNGVGIMKLDAAYDDVLNFLGT